MIRQNALLQEFPFGIPGQPSEELSEPRTTGPRSLYELWLSKRGDAEMPKKTQFGPAEMIRYVSWTYMLDILDEGKDFRVRLYGTELADMVGKDYTGVLLSETPDEINWKGEIYQLAYRRRSPIFYVFNLAPFGREYIWSENAIFPLADDDGKLAFFLCMTARIEAPDIVY